MKEKDMPIDFNSPKVQQRMADFCRWITRFADGTALDDVPKAERVLVRHLGKAMAEQVVPLIEQAEPLGNQEAYQLGILTGYCLAVSVQKGALEALD